MSTVTINPPPQAPAPQPPTPSSRGERLEAAWTFARNYQKAKGVLPTKAEMVQFLEALYPNVKGSSYGSILHYLMAALKRTNQETLTYTGEKDLVLLAGGTPRVYKPRNKNNKSSNQTGHGGPRSAADAKERYRRTYLYVLNSGRKDIRPKHFVKAYRQLYRRGLTDQAASAMAQAASDGFQNLDHYQSLRTFVKQHPVTQENAERFKSKKVLSSGPKASGQGSQKPVGMERIVSEDVPGVLIIHPMGCDITKVTKNDKLESITFSHGPVSVQVK